MLLIGSELVDAAADSHNSRFRVSFTARRRGSHSDVNGTLTSIEPDHIRVDIVREGAQNGRDRNRGG
jgi:hypothetical protein